MIKSKYNIIHVVDNNYILYNTFSKAIVVLDENEYKEYLRDEISCIETELCLKKNGFFIEDEFDEKKYLEYFHYKTRFNHESMILTIAPTLSCNFDCPYCFEEKRPGKMTQVVMDGIINFIEKKFISGVNFLDLTWYGGEPLLVPEIIYFLSESIINLCERYDVKYKQLLITNGYFLSEEVCLLLRKVKIDNLQITLDGLASNHDKRRYLKNGGGTFNKIFTNLSNVAKAGLSVDIRMNVDTHNFSDYYKLKGIVSEIPELKARVYPAIVEKIRERKTERNDYYMNSKEYEKFIVENKQNGVIDEGICEIMDNRCYFCSAELENTYVIDELGNTYKCWDEIGKKESVCFNIADTDDKNYSAILDYMGGSPFEDASCSDCELLPLCFGGCRFQKKYLDHSVCAFSRDRINKYLEKQIE